MLFNTFAFALVFLPITLIGYFALSARSLRLSIVFLFAASIAFYAYWDVRFLPLLLGSIAVNFGVGRRICTHREAARPRRARLVLIGGLAFNLVLLGFFKYADFIGTSLAWLAGTPYEPLGITLPIGISFFTFTQIAYLVDCHVAQVREYKPENYGLFVTYFPHLIAGPILHHKDMMPQFDRPDVHVFSRPRLVVGTAFFVIGLAKKVVLADGVARFVAPVFDVHHAQLTLPEAWCGALAYTFQLYFDFSAYCDMAYGLSYMFGIVLPMNFASPYKACSIIDFWRRWHITLSNFLRDYLYIPLGGSRRGSVRRYANLMITMLLGGLWHGASWTFVAWGGLHGAYLAINHAIRHLLGERDSRWRTLCGWAATFLAVVVGWVFFRAPSFDVALDVLRAMAHGTYTGDASAALTGDHRIMALDEGFAWVGVCALIAFGAPNAFELIGNRDRWRAQASLAGLGGGVVLGAALVAALFALLISETRGVSEFLYFNF